MRLLIVVALVVLALPGRAVAATSFLWPSTGQASYVLGGAAMLSSPHQRAVPIASVAKVMTAYRVLQRYPLRPGQRGFVLTVTPRDVADTRLRASRGESLVPVRAGERLSEVQALAALLLPSANNIAIMLARKVSGSVAAFVRLMNATARAFRMRHTHYTDPSGFASTTTSTAADQTRLVPHVLRLAVFRRLVATKTYRIPVAGTIHNTDTLLGHDGFAGVKTGSMDASGGCFVFVSHRLVSGRRTDIVGVVLGQHGPDLIAAGLAAARGLVDLVAPRSA